MTALTGHTKRDTYKDLLQLSNNNGGLVAGINIVYDGKGTASPLGLSSAQISLNGTIWPTTLGTAGWALLTDGAGGSSWGSVATTATIASATMTFTNKFGLISQWTNDVPYATATNAITFSNKSGNISQWTNDSGYLIHGDQLIFQTIAVSGQSDVVAGTISDTLTLVAGSNITLTTNSGANSVTINANSGGGSGVSDGTYGDITVSGVGTVMTIPASTVTYAKMQNVSATNKVLGRTTAGAGVVEEISCTITPGAVLSGSNTGDQTNISGNAATVTTNANLTGPITSVGNATSIASQTGTGTKFVVDTSPTLVTPVLGVATATSINKLTVTAPATGSTLTIADGQTLTVNGSATITNGTHSGTNTGDQTNVTGSSGSCTGNAATATALQNARTIGGVSFDGTANIIPDTITVASNSTNASYYIPFFTSNTGALQPQSDIDITYNPSTNTLTVPTVVASLTGNISGNATTVTTNANLTGPITSVGNATSIASQTGTGTKFVVDTSPTLVTPVLGVATVTSINKVAITAPATGSTLTLADGTTLTVNGSTTLTNGTHSGTNTGDQNLFSTVAVSGQSNVVADGTSDTLTLVAGTNVTITTDAGSDSITINSTGGGGLSDGDYGDVTVSGVGTVLTVDSVTVADAAADATTWPMLSRSVTGSNQVVSTDPGLTYDASANSLATTTFVGALTGNASTATALATARAIGGVNFDGTAAITPANITIANEATDTTCFPLFTTAATGDLPPKSNASLTFNSNTASLGCTTFVGALTGNVTGNVTGSSGSCTGNSATVTTNADLTGDVTSSGNTTTAAAALITGKTVKATPEPADDYVLIYDAAGTALKKATITSIQGGASSAYVYITEGTASNSAALEFTGLSSTYACYVFEFLNIVPATNSVLLNMRTSSNNGSSYDSTAGHYAWVGTSTEGTEDPTQNGNGSTSATSIVLSPLSGDTWGSAAEERGCGTVKLFDHSNTGAYTRIYANFSVFGASGAQMISSSGGCRLAAADVDAVQFYFSSGNIESGTIKVYGIKAS